MWQTILETLIQYGVLGIIAVLYMKHISTVEESNKNNFQTMLESIMKKDDNETVINTVLQTITSHNQNSTSLLLDLSNKVELEIDKKKLLFDSVCEYSRLVEELKSCLHKIKEQPIDKELINIMIREGYITEEELTTCKKILEAQEISMVMEEIDK